MKKRGSIGAKIASVLAACVMLAGCAGKPKRVDPKGEENLQNQTNVLVVYFSWSGNLQKMAHWISEETGGDILRVTTKEEYPENYDDTADRAKEEVNNGIRPELNIDLTQEQLDKYDVIYFGFPVWWYDLPMPMWTFLESYDFSGKTVIPFFSHEGSSDGAGSLPTITRLIPNATVRTEDALSIRGKKVKNSEDETKEWVRKVSAES
ncbi:MAG: flavodoxin [Clostridiales bacterium]|nr:flavodoxin [Clostridiales bacterium]